MSNFLFAVLANPHRETLPGGYYGNNPNRNGNANAVNPASENTEDEGAGDEGVADQGAGEGASPDYDGAGAGGGEGGGEEENPGAGADDSQQNPAEDPDIQQLQNFGGPVGDNFPEGLFPPGLLTQDDINEIRKQQEKQAKEAEEKERQQQQQQADQSGQGGQPDYEDNGGDDSNGAGTGEEVPTDGTGAGEGDGAAEGAAGEAGPEDGAADNGAAQGNDAQINSGALGGNGIAPVSPVQQGYNPSGYGNANAYNPVNQNMQTPPAAYKNTYQPIQPQLQPMMNLPRVPLQPSIEYANGNYPNSGLPNAQSPMGVNQMNNQPFGGYQPGGKHLSNLCCHVTHFIFLYPSAI